MKNINTFQSCWKKNTCSMASLYRALFSIAIWCCHNLDNQCQHSFHLKAVLTLVKRLATASELSSYTGPTGQVMCNINIISLVYLMSQLDKQFCGWNQKFSPLNDDILIYPENCKFRDFVIWNKDIYVGCHFLRGGGQHWYLCLQLQDVLSSYLANSWRSTI